MIGKKAYAGYSSVYQSIALLKMGLPDYIADGYFVSSFRVNKQHGSYIRSWIEHFYYDDFTFYRKPMKSYMPDDIVYYDQFFVITTIYVMPAFSARLLKAMLPLEFKNQVNHIDDVIKLLQTKQIYYNKIINKFSKV